MMKYKIVLFFLGFLIEVQAQDKPVFFPEDIEATTLQAKCLCKPGVINKSRGRGVEISFLHVANSRLNAEEGFPLSSPNSEWTLQQLSVKLRFPIINKMGFKLLGGFIYRPEHFDFRKIGIDYQPVFNYLNDKTMKSSGFESILTKSWNDKHYSSFRFRVLYNGDYAGLIDIKNDYAIYNISGFFGIKKTENKEWGVGLNFSHSFRNTLVLPFLLYNHTFNNKWGIESVLPTLINGRYNISEQSILFLGIRYNSRSYAIETDEAIPQAYGLNHSEIRTALTLEQKIHPWIWLEGTAGIQYNFSTDFDAKNSSLSFQVEPGTEPFFKFGIFVSPPDSFFK